MAPEKAPYDPTSDIFAMQRPGVAVDVVLLSILRNELQVALIQRQDDPYFGKYALPGRFVRYDERIEDTARKALEDKGRIDTKEISLEQLYTFGQNLVRDTRIRTISIIYVALLPSEVITRQEGNLFTWHSVTDLPPLAFDHADVVRFAIQRIREQLFTTPNIFRLLPKAFTLSQLQHACEMILGHALDKRNFRKKAEELFVLQDLHRTHREGAHRPARLYAYKGMRAQIK